VNAFQNTLRSFLSLRSLEVPSGHDIESRAYDSVASFSSQADLVGIYVTTEASFRFGMQRAMPEMLDSGGHHDRSFSALVRKSDPARSPPPFTNPLNSSRHGVPVLHDFWSIARHRPATLAPILYAAISTSSRAQIFRKRFHQEAMEDASAEVCVALVADLIR